MGTHFSSLTRPSNRERGSVTPLILGFMVILLSATLGLLSLAEAHSRFVQDDGKRQAAVSLAEAGTDHILWRLRQPADAAGHYGPLWRTVSDERDIPLGSGSYHLASLDENIAGVKGLRLQGWIPNRADPKAVSAELYIEVAPVYWKPWAGAALGDVGVPVANGDTDSYKSTEGNYGTGPIYSNGDVATNSTAPGAISISSQGYVRGKAYYPKGAPPTVVSGANKVSGGIGPNPADTTFLPIPNPPLDAVYLQPITGNTVRRLDGTVMPQPLAPGTYIVTASGGNSISLTGNDTLNVGGTGQTIFYLAGNANIGGNGIVNATARPTNMLIYGMKPDAASGIPGCLDIDISGNGNFYGAVYAPQADITLNGGGARGSVYGSLAGKRVSFNGNGTIIHYDESLRELSGVIRAYQLNTWTQTR